MAVHLIMGYKTNYDGTTVLGCYLRLRDFGLAAGTKRAALRPGCQTKITHPEIIELNLFYDDTCPSGHISRLIQPRTVVPS